MTLAQIEIGRVETLMKLKQLREKSRWQEKDLEDEILELDRLEKLLLNGLDLNLIQLAEHVVKIRMSSPLQGDDSAEIHSAIADLATGAHSMRTGFFGTKNYDRWDHQGQGLTSYGYGPKHGSIVFAIGLQECHQMRNGETPRALTDDEINAGIYMLKMLEAGKYITPEMMRKSA